MVVLDEAGDPVGEGVFGADADRPTAASVAHRSDRAGRDEGEGDIISLPRAAALDVAKEAVPGITDAASHRGNRLDLKAIREVREKDAISVPMGVGPIVVTLYAEHPPAGELIIAAGLHTSEHAVGVRAEGLTEERIARPESRSQNGEILVDPKAADVAAGVAAGPAENVNGWRRSRQRPP